MTGMFEERNVADVSKTFSRGIRNRIGFLVLVSTLTVALAFGLSFYFALISNESAVARQIPGLEEVAARLKSLLVMNTLAFVAIIILSFLVLSSIITAGMFNSLAVLHKELLALRDGKLPRPREAHERGPFSALEEALSTAISNLRERERKEIEELSRIAEALVGAAAAPYAAQKLEELIKGKRVFMGEAAPAGDAGAKEKRRDPLFIQPL